MILYTADRNNTLKPGIIDSLTKYNDISPKELQILADEWFPNGVSNHGNTYFLDKNALSKTNNSSIELIFELIRRLEYPEIHSRLEAKIYATDSIEEAKNFVKKYGGNSNAETSIWKIECDSFHKGDMSLLTVNNSNLVTIHLARLYWEGKTLSQIDTHKPFWEYLLFGPVKVIEKVDSV